MGKRRMIDMDGLLLDMKLIEGLNTSGALVYIRLWTIAEDWGGFPYDPAWVFYQMGGLIPIYTIEKIQLILERLVEYEKIIIYEDEKQRKFGWLKNFLKHQILLSPIGPKLPLPNWIIWHPKLRPTDPLQYYEVLAPYDITHGLSKDKPMDIKNATHGLLKDESMGRKKITELEEKRINTLSLNSEYIRKGESIKPKRKSISKISLNSEYQNKEKTKPKTQEEIDAENLIILERKKEIEEQTGSSVPFEDLSTSDIDQEKVQIISLADNKKTIQEQIEIETDPERLSILFKQLEIKKYENL